MLCANNEDASGIQRRRIRSHLEIIPKPHEPSTFTPRECHLRTKEEALSHEGGMGLRNKTSCFVNGEIRGILYRKHLSLSPLPPRCYLQLPDN